MKTAPDARIQRIGSILRAKSLRPTSRAATSDRLEEVRSDGLFFELHCLKRSPVYVWHNRDPMERSVERFPAAGTSRDLEQAYTHEIERFEPPSNALFTIEMTAQFVGLPRRTIAVCCKHGLVASAIRPNDGYYFDQGAIRALRRIESLCSVCGDDFPAIKIILDLMSQLDHLQTEVRGTRESANRVKRAKTQ